MAIIRFDNLGAIGIIKDRVSDPVVTYLSGGWELSSASGSAELYAAHKRSGQQESP